MEAPLSSQHEPAENSSSPIVQFARYVGGVLELFKARTNELEYIAISHVWGEIQWLQVPGIEHKILVSEQKALFIQNKLASLVGASPFWMDTLTVNQRDPKEVVATVQAIPAIFRDAVKTIAVREGDGFYNCCLAIAENFESWEDLADKLMQHSDEHWDDYYRESYLQRLWTLQECFLSHTIQFVNGDDNEPKKKPKDRNLDVYSNRTDVLWANDSLYALALAFHPPNVHGSHHYSSKAPRRFDEDIYSELFREMQLYSNRSATKPRDYIFATMPQFPWYHYPEDAVELSFNAIFKDFYEQARRAGRTFACRITRSMTELQQGLTAAEAWYPSSQQPEPTTLGDFMKLLGQRIDIAEDRSNYHLTTSVTVTSVNLEDRASTFALLESAMQFSVRKWHYCHRAGELTRYGSWPQGEPVEIRVLRYEIERIEANEPSSPEREAKVAQLRADIDEAYQRRPEDELLEEAQRTVDILLATIDPFSQDAGMQGDGAHFKRELLGDCHPRFLEYLVLLSAMVSCQIPLSAAVWGREHFIPVRVDYKEFQILGLLAKHAVGSDISNGQDMASAGRHPNGASIGKDLAIVDFVSKMPVGLLPDFLEAERTDEEYVTRISALYRGLTLQVTPKGSVLHHVPLDMFRLAAREA